MPSFYPTNTEGGNPPIGGNELKAFYAQTVSLGLPSNQVTSVLNGSGSRKYTIFSNTGSTTILIGMNQYVSPNVYHLKLLQGESKTVEIEWFGAYWAYTAGEGGNLTITELTVLPPIVEA